jgi:hypothetical protein
LCVDIASIVENYGGVWIKFSRVIIILDGSVVLALLSEGDAAIGKSLGQEYCPQVSRLDSFCTFSDGNVWVDVGASPQGFILGASRSCTDQHHDCHQTEDVLQSMNAFGYRGNANVGNSSHGPLHDGSNTSFFGPSADLQPGEWKGRNSTTQLRH